MRKKKVESECGKSKVMRCSRYGNGGRMHVILNGEPLEEVDYFKYLGSQVAVELGWMDGVKVALGNSRMTVEAARKFGKSGDPWYICN